MARRLYKIPEYDVVLTYSPIIEITGHLFECFDYYLFLRERYKVGIMLFNGMPVSALRTAFESKYDIEFDDVEKDLILIDGASRENMVDVYIPPKTFLLVADGNFKAAGYNGIHFMGKRMFGFLCERDPGEFPGMPHNITYLQDYRIYGKNALHNSIDYVKKLPFKYYRKCALVDEKIGMMYMTYVCRKVGPEVVADYLARSGCTSSILVVPYKLAEYDGIPGITQVVAPVADFFDKFGTYIYLPVQRRFDCSPRLVTECCMHGKKVFMDLDYSDPGLETRLSDARSDLRRLNLADGDPILDIIERYRAS